MNVEVDVEVAYKADVEFGVEVRSLLTLRLEL